MNIRHIKNNKGFTLIELMIAVVLFVVVMTVATDLFSRAADTQGKAVGQKNLQEGLDYSLALIKKEAEGAKQSVSGCDASCTGSNFFCIVSGSTLYIRNKNDQCLKYFLNTDTNGVQRLAVTINNQPASPYFTYITPADVNITALNFSALTSVSVELPTAALTTSIVGKPVNGVNVDILNLQTTMAVRPFVCGQTIYDRDNFSYKTILIGNQCWMAENLRTKTKPDGTCVNTGASFSVPFCLKNVAGVDYGGETDSGRDCIDWPNNSRGDETDCMNGYALYRWSAAMNLASSCDTSNCAAQITSPYHQGLCPIGWHIPTNTEHLTIESNVDLLDGDDTDNDGGAYLKATGNSGFNAIMTGDRQTNGSTFTSAGDYDTFWSATQSIPPFTNNDAYFSILTTTTSTFVNWPDKKKYSIMVRCLKD